MPSKVNNHFIKRLQCPVCQSDNLKVLYTESYESDLIKNYLDDFYNPQGGVEHEYLVGTDFSLQKCSNCDLVYQENVPNDDLMFRLYEQWIDPNIVCEARDKLPLWYYESYANQLLDLVSFFNKPPNNLEYLDFGMGWGKWCLMAKAFGCQVYGLELSKERIAYAKRNGIKVLDETDLNTHQFDYINTDQVFEHIPNPLQVLHDLVALLKPEGIIKISVPNGNQVEHLLETMDWSAKKGHQNSLNVVAPLEHINCFKTKTIMILAEACNLELIEVPRARQNYRSKTDFLKKLIKKMIRTKPKSTNLYFRKINV